MPKKEHKPAKQEESGTYQLELRLLITPPPIKGPLDEEMEGDDVRTWQRFLQAQGHAIAPDGVFGSATKKITAAFQKKHGLVADGIAGEQTLAKARALGLENPRLEVIQRDCNDRRDYPMVAKWIYVVSKRMRLAGQGADENLEELELLIADYLQPKIGKIEGVKKQRAACAELIQQLASADVIEVGIPHETEKKGWAARLFPWENALSIATRRHRRKPLVVVRHLDARPAAILHPQTAPRTLIVRSTPGEFRATYDFQSESELVRYKLHQGAGGGNGRCVDLDTPTRGELEAAIKKTKPEIIHLAVLDTHFIAQTRPGLLGKAWEEREENDGIILAGAGSAYGPVDAADSAKLLTVAATKPVLVAFATCYSAARLAPLAVAAGAHIAIGFQDELFNTVSEAFFGAFYEAWRELGWDTLAAFGQALTVLRGQPESGRSGVALWCSASLVRERAKGGGKPPVRKVFRPAPAAPAAPALKIDAVSVHEIFSVQCEAPATVNYCSLHNGRDLFTRFSVQKKQPGIVPPVEIRVELTAENETAAWRHIVLLGDAPGSEDLAGKVRVPLGARALRRVQESVRSSLFVEVRCAGHLLRQLTLPITLLPVDEWRDTKEDRRWLPSFVLPRDPAIRRIMTAADRYLRALCDTSGAGFDGYQQAVAWPEVVDLQARAIWCALLFDLQLRYINPPPTYSRPEGDTPAARGFSQRLRTPGQIVEEGRGTCIDFALLFASCLEYVGIYPVVFLIAGHAFPGWWRSEEAYRDFLAFRFLPEMGAAEAGKKAAPVAKDDFAGWMVTGEDGFRELVPALRNGGLAALESTLVCTGGAFAEALVAGRENLADPAIFDALVNIQSARDSKNPVTPLPIVGDFTEPQKP